MCVCVCVCVRRLALAGVKHFFFLVPILGWALKGNQKHHHPVLGCLYLRHFSPVRRQFLGIYFHREGLRTTWETDEGMSFELLRELVGLPEPMSGAFERDSFFQARLGCKGITPTMC